MKSGADFRMEAIEQLGDFGEIRDFELTYSDGDKLTKDDVSKKILMVNFVEARNFESSKSIEQIKWIQNQFQDRLLKRDDFMFLTHIAIDSIKQLQDIQRIINEEENRNFKRWNLAGGERSELEELAKESYKLPLKSGETPFENPYLAITDIDSEVRYYYNVFEKEEIAKLMMHMSTLLPQEDDRKVEIKTEAKN
jgi:hypothetical protein